jgi:hypothetical protein
MWIRILYFSKRMTILLGIHQVIHSVVLNLILLAALQFATRLALTNALSRQEYSQTGQLHDPVAGGIPTSTSQHHLPHKELLPPSDFYIILTSPGRN